MSLNERKDKSGKIAEVELHLGDREKQVLAECRAAIQGDAELDDLRDATLARYLRHNSWVVEPAVKQMKEYLAWRKREKIDEILSNDNFPSKETIRTLIPYAYHGEDREGRPIYIEKTGMIATAALADPSLCPPEHLMHSHIYGVELMMKRMHELSLARGQRVNGICTILDFEGLGFHHRQCLSVLKVLLDFDKQYYPEYLGKLYIINCPWVGPYLYTAVQVFLDEVTKARIQIISGDPSEFLLSQIAHDHLPSQYGGNCTGERCRRGGLGDTLPAVKGCIDVLDSSKLKPAGAPADASGLDSQEISYDFEKVVTAAKEGDVFTWYFEVLNGYDIDFSVELLPASGVRESSESKRVLIQKVARLRNGKGTFKAPFAGAKLVFRWDNNFSWMAGKSLRYTVQCQTPTEELQSLMASANSAKELKRAAAEEAAAAQASGAGASASASSK
jgi:hypothetical protein